MSVREMLSEWKAAIAAVDNYSDSENSADDISNKDVKSLPFSPSVEGKPFLNSYSNIKQQHIYHIHRMKKCLVMI